jgi:hypothetical protein
MEGSHAKHSKELEVAYALRRSSHTSCSERTGIWNRNTTDPSHFIPYPNAIECEMDNKESHTHPMHPKPCTSLLRISHTCNDVPKSSRALWVFFILILTTPLLRYRSRQLPHLMRDQQSSSASPLRHCPHQYPRCCPPQRLVRRMPCSQPGCQRLWL